MNRGTARSCGPSCFRRCSPVPRPAPPVMSLEKKFTRIRDLRNRLAHHEAVWKFQEEDPVSGGYGHGAGAEQNDESRHARKRKYYLKKNKQIRDDYPKSDLFNKASLYYKRTINGRSMH